MKKSNKFSKLIIDNFRFICGGLSIFVAFLFPYFEGASPDALTQIFSLATLSVAALMFRTSAISPVMLAALMAVVLMIVLQPIHYPGSQIAGVAGLSLAGVASCVGVRLQREPQKLTWVLAAILAAGFVNAVEGLLQWLGLVGNLSPWVIEPAHRGLAYGAFRQRNLFATFLCVSALCTVWLHHRRRITEPMAWFLLLILVFGIAASSSRTGILEVIALGFFGVVWRKQQKSSVTRLLVGQPLLLGCALLVLPVAARLHGFEFVSGAERVTQANEDARLIIWSNAIELIFQRPWLGWGWAEIGYGHYVTLFEKRYDGLIDNLHSLPLQFAVAFGLPAVIVLIYAVSNVFIFKKLIKFKPVSIRGSDTQISERSFAWGILLVIVGIHSMLEYPLWYAGFLFLTGLALGYVLPDRIYNNSFIIYERWVERLTKIITLALLILAFLAWQQYSRVLPIYKTPFTNDREARFTATRDALVRASGSWLFQAQLDFATLDSLEVTSQNAIEVKKLAEKLLHYSAEPRVIEPLLLSLWHLNEVALLHFHAKRFCVAFPTAFQRWSNVYENHPMFITVRRTVYGCRPVISQNYQG